MHSTLVHPNTHPFNICFRYTQPFLIPRTLQPFPSCSFAPFHLLLLFLPDLFFGFCLFARFAFSYLFMHLVLFLFMHCPPDWPRCKLFIHYDPYNPYTCMGPSPWPFTGFYRLLPSPSALFLCCCVFGFGFCAPALFFFSLSICPHLLPLARLIFPSLSFRCSPSLFLTPLYLFIYTNFFLVPYSLHLFTSYPFTSLHSLAAHS